MYETERYDEPQKPHGAGWLAAGCFGFLVLAACGVSFVGGVTYLVVNVLFCGDLSFWACCGIGLVLGVFLGVGRR